MPQLTRPGPIFDTSYPIGDGSGNFPYAGPSPTIEVKGTMQVGPILRAGFLEFGTFTNPPKVYATYSVSGTLKTSFTDAVGSPHSGSTEWDGTGTNVSFASGGNDSSITTVSGSSSSTGTGNKFCGYWGGLLGIVKTTSDGGPSLNTGNFTPMAGAANGAAATLSGSGATGYIGVTGTTWTSGTIHYTVNSGTLTIALGNLISDATAIADTTLANDTSEAGPYTDFGAAAADLYGFTSRLFALYETRQTISAPAFNFGYQTAQFVIYLDKLRWGGATTYQLVIQFEQQTAAGDGSGHTSLYGGTWNYLSGHDVTITVSPSADTWDNSGSPVTIPQSVGYQTRIKSIALKPCWA